MNLRDLGWKSADGLAPRLSVDMNGTDRWSVARMRSSDSTLHSLPVAKRMMRAIITIDGEATLTTTAGTMPLPPRYLVLFRDQDYVITSNSERWTRIYWNVDSPLTMSSRFEGVPIRPLPLSDSYFRFIAEISSSLIQALDRREESSHLLLAEAVGATLAASITSSTSTPADREQSDRDGLYREAQSVIEEMHRDAALTVSALARILSVSESHLHRAFAHEGRTPAQEIEKRRLMTAYLLLEVAPNSARLSDDLAMRAGFTSARRLRHAMRRGGQRQEESEAPSINDSALVNV